jgi:radical SAM superfamily enzyme YgiQ (UPF0313 family)
MSSLTEKFYQYSTHLLSREQNVVHVKKEAPLSIALVYPNSYEVGMANLGFQTLYRLLNDVDEIRCERMFYNEDFPSLNRTLETTRQLNHFDVIAFSISFELDYFNVVKILQNSGIAPLTHDRHVSAPIIIAGGAASLINPVPIAPFMDLVFIGEIESSFDILVKHLLKQKDGSIPKTAVIEALSHYEGFFSPQFFQPGSKIIHVTVDLKGRQPQYTPVLTPLSHFSETFLVEVGRGCGRHCRFCVASHIYHPVRFYRPQQIIDTIKDHNKGAHKIGLVGAALCDYPWIEELIENLIAKNYEVGLSSFRFELISKPFLSLIEKAGIKTITLAPEAGTEQLRDLIHKPLLDEQIISAIELIAESAIANLKLYFLIGLPYETENDILGIVEIVKQIYSIFVTTRKRGLSLSVNAFIPKPFTPFQWSAMQPEKEIKRKRTFIENELRKLHGISYSKKNVRLEIQQAVLSQGDSHATDYLLSKLSLKEVCEKLKIYNKKDFQQSMPWDFIDYPIRKEKLWQEFAEKKLEI